MPLTYIPNAKPMNMIEKIKKWLHIDSPKSEQAPPTDREESGAGRDTDGPVSQVMPKDYTAEQSENADNETSRMLERLIRESAALIDQYDTLANNEADPSVADTYRRLGDDLTVNLVLCGCEAINPKPGDRYDSGRHRTTPLTWPEDAIVQRTVRMGVAYGRRVYAKAIVEI